MTLISPHGGAGTSAGTLHISVNNLDEKIQSKSKANLYQVSTIIDMNKFAEAPDEVALKDQIREDLRYQMARNLSENLAFTRLNDHANDTMTITARCYVFTREQLVEMCREIINGQ